MVKLRLMFIRINSRTDLKLSSKSKRDWKEKLQEVSQQLKEYYKQELKEDKFTNTTKEANRAITLCEEIEEENKKLVAEEEAKAQVEAQKKNP